MWPVYHKFCIIKIYQFNSVQLLSHVPLFATPWTAARQASLYNTKSWNLLKLMSIKSVMPSNHLILCGPILPWWLRGESICLQCGRPGFDPWVRKIPWRRKWQSTPVFLPGESHGRRSLVGYSPQGRRESDTTERLHLTFC